MQQEQDLASGTLTNRSDNKRKLLTNWDSGLGKEQYEGDLFLYEQHSPIERDPESRDSAWDEAEFSLQKPSWLTNEEPMDLTNVAINTNTELPEDFKSLICGDALHGKDESPTSSNLRRSVFSNGEVTKPNKAFTKSESATEFYSTKRIKVGESCSPAYQRSLSFDEENIKHVLQRSSIEPDLIGDFSKVCILPLTLGRHQDLKSITATTLASLINGKYEKQVDDYKIVDCRFPYEFDGGHIAGAINIYMKEQIMDMLNNCMHSGAILIFHCEFSSERGPSLYRFLRKYDRKQNEYPKLNYPEMYLLEGGYKKFFDQYADLCEPKAYKPMLDPEHQLELRHFKAQSKSFKEDRLRPNNRGNFKCLGFM